jgi:trigger factor
MALDASTLKVSLETGERWRRTLNVTVPGSAVATERSRIAGDLAKRLRLPGFRKGRIPRDFVDKKYGASLDSEAIEKVIGEAYRAALGMEKLTPISEGEVEDIQYKAGEDLSFAISFDVAPEMELARLSGFAVERPEASVSEEDVQKVLERVREQNGSWQEVDEGVPVGGDLVEVEVRKLEGGEASGESQPYQFILGQGDAIPDVERAIETLTPGSEGTFTVTFPEDFPNEDRRGDSEELSISLKSRRTMELPDLTDDFAKSLGEFDTLEDLTSRIREDLQKDADRRAEEAVRSRLLDLVLDANPFEVPDSMVKRYLESVLGEAKGLDEEKLEELRSSLRPEAERAVKRILVIDRIAETQGLNASEEELDDRIEAIAESNNASPAEVYARLQKSGQLESLEREITEGKVFDLLKEQSEITQAT